MSPTDYTGFLKLLYDWQTIITGGLAIVAAIIGAWAAYHIGNAQIAAAKRKDRLQAQCIAVAISPELLDFKVRHERASKIINEEFPKVKAQRPSPMTDAVVALILDARIELPPLLSRTVDQLYILGETGPTLLQLISVTLQYNNMVTTLAGQIRQHVDSFDPPEHQKHLSGHLRVIGQDIGGKMQTDANCVFCKIIAGQIPCVKLLEDDATLAFMDINPANDGHCLVITKGHYPTVFEISDEAFAAVALSVRKVARAVNLALSPEGLNLVQANGEGAKQSVKHFHIHVLPRKRRDDLKLNWDIKPGSPETIAALADQIRAYL